MAPPSPHRLILASASPRRATLLTDAGYRFEQMIAHVDEGVVALDGLPIIEAVKTLASMKAASVAEQLDQGIVIGCDTMVVDDGAGMGKPTDAPDARRMLELLIGRPHQVVTGVAIIDADSGRQLIFCDEAMVTISAPPPTELDQYLSSGQWQGKAGGYNLAELQDRWSINVVGDPTTVIGLPMQRLSEALDQMTRGTDIS
ncbi:MAG: septum formation protein Maf [Planctomycetaceae bacterium]|nr:septum formation protein Maf [Planctomycetaceae bacterium]